MKTSNVTETALYVLKVMVATAGTVGLAILYNLAVDAMVGKIFNGDN